jgi:hypothetical protein
LKEFQMPLEGLFADDVAPDAAAEPRRGIYEKFGIVNNPFPSAAQTSGHPHMPTDSDRLVDAAVREFYQDRGSQVIAVTASQGIGKTNLLNAYEAALREKLGPRGFFVIRYVADPEPSFDPLIRSIFEVLGEEHLRRTVQALREVSQAATSTALGSLRTVEVGRVISALLRAQCDSEDRFEELIPLAQQWLLGLPVRKQHREELKIQFRLDTVESKTRALRDIVYLSAEVKTLEGVFLLLDELEKQDLSLSKTFVLRYLAALRALIDALPQFLFLMVALTTDALDRYREMLPALRGRLANTVTLSPIRDEREALLLFEFYLDYARREAESFGQMKGWKAGSEVLLSRRDAMQLFADLLRRSTIGGVRQREYLNELHKAADEVIGASTH